MQIKKKKVIFCDQQNNWFFMSHSDVYKVDIYTMSQWLKLEYGQKHQARYANTGTQVHTHWLR